VAPGSSIVKRYVSRDLYSFLEDGSGQKNFGDNDKAI
jgi:hypothetical protein